MDIINLNLSRTERRLLLQGVWKEQTMYSTMKQEARDQGVVEHATNMLKTLDNLENKLLGW